MKKFYYLALCTLVGVTLSSCGMFGGGGNNEPKFSLGDLQGYWQENNTEHFIRFTTEKSDENPYYLGYEWDEADEILESDLLESRETLGHPGNGWFKYDFTLTDGGLHEIHLMDNEGAEIPKEYIVSKLNDSELEYYEKDRPSSKFAFQKVVKGNAN